MKLIIFLSTWRDIKIKGIKYEMDGNLRIQENSTQHNKIHFKHIVRVVCYDYLHLYCVQ